MKTEQIIEQLDRAFANRAVKPSSCIDRSSNSILYIDDNKEKGFCIFADVNLELDQSSMFKINNQSQQDILLFAVDGKFIKTGTPAKRCDCIFFSNQHFCFAEFKFNATSLKPETVLENRTKAIEQLEASIILIDEAFEKHKYDFLGLNREAYLCTPETYPRKNTAISDFAVLFLENFGVQLFELNEKTC